MKLYTLIFCLLFSLTAFAQADGVTEEEYKDPFSSVIPEEAPAGSAGQAPGQEEAVAPPQVTVEGIIWGVKTPQAIIDGDVYKTGDILKSVDATVFKIEKSVVSLQYKGKIFETGIQKGTTEQKEAQ
ncbi:MAG: hypothetical protein PHQ96_07740 [Candidatus Omnitrophica bacterium]|nr:hypothetical protein [Candidatus Omnitrophota bacterium]